MKRIYSVIIPAVNEEKRIRRCLDRIPRDDPAVEIIVADGGSLDGTAAVSRAAGVRVIVSARGRGIQCNRGSEAAGGDILVFLHADTHLPPDAFDRIRALFSSPEVKIATFRLRFDHPHWLLRVYAFVTRFDSVWTRFGDQGIVVRRKFFEDLGGFPDWPLFEDVDLLQKARQRAKIHSIPSAVVTSASKFIANGIVRQQVRNARLIFKYLRGVPPERLAKEYAREEKPT